MLSDKVFKALSDANRRKIISLLRKKDMTAGEIADNFDISKPSISEHLKILKNADLISSEKKGQFITYFLNSSILEDVISYFMEISNPVVPMGKEKNVQKISAPHPTEKCCNFHHVSSCIQFTTSILQERINKKDKKQNAERNS